MNSKKRWFFLGLATLSQVSVAVIRMGIPALMPFIKNELNLSHIKVGLITSVLNGGAAAAGIPGGMAADRWGERMVIGYGTIASGIVIIGINGVSSFPTLLLLLLLTGFATTTSVPAGGRAVAGWFQEKDRGTAMGVRQMGIPLGGAISAFALPSLAVSFDWRFALALSGVIAIGIGFIALRLYEEPPTSVHGRMSSQAVGLKSLLTQNNMYPVLLYAIIFSVAQWSYLTYLMLYLTETLLLPITLAANLLALGQMCGAGGRIGWGLLSDRLFGGKRKPALFLIGVFAILVTVWTSFFSPQTPFWQLSIAVAFMGLTLQGWNGLTHTLASEVAGTQMAGRAVGLINTIGFLGVIFVTPVFGLLVDWGGSYRLAWLALACLVLVALSGLSLLREKR